MSVINVSSVSTLEAALKTAHAGDTIALAAGTYSGVSINGANFNSAVTITSANLSHPAVLEGLNVANSSGLTFENLNMTSQGVSDPYYAFRVSASQNLHFDHLDVYGNLSNAADTQVNGFLLEGTSNVSFTNSEFQDLCAGIVTSNNANVTIDNNAFWDLNKGGIEAGGTSGLTIENNNFSDFQSAAGVHADAIQVFTDATEATDNLTITGNLYDRGAGDPAQGIFIQQLSGNAAIENAVIDNNSIIGGEWNSIMVNGVAGTLQIEHNTVASWAGYDVTNGGTTDFAGWIRLAGNTATLTETGNLAQDYVLNSTTVAAPAGNALTGSVTDNGMALLTAWGHANPTAIYSLAPDIVSQLQGIHLASTVGIV